MRGLWPALLALIWLALLPAIGLAAEPVPLPALTTRVTDLTATLDSTQRGRLEAQLAAIDRSGRAQVAVLLLPTTQPETIEQFGIRLAEAWKVGRKGADNGVIVIVAKADRNMRIEVGYGLEGSIPDAIAKRIIAERMAPAFKQGDFFGGLQAAVAALDQAIGGSAAGTPAAPLPASTKQAADKTDLFPWLMGAAVVGGVLRSLFGLFGALLAGVIAGGLGFFIFGSVLAAGLAGVLVFVFSFFNLLSRGGGFGGGGGFSGGGGGFSGGGGGFGGGGASGRW
ncbi:MAG: TPM domain-containing protein [Sulfuritalea sp.]|nr:TPM domain-containing protein [Sulfuritalea sp.]MDP1982506.1 TPM domain-containing protein [Sulfuritalea sp.]